MIPGKAIFIVAVSALMVTPVAAVDWRNVEAVADAAIAAHPAAAALQHRIEAARELVASAGAYPNPMIMGGVQNRHIDLSNDEIMTMFMVGASQTLPRAARREAERESARIEVRLRELEAAIVKQEIRRDAELAWYDLAAADSQITATEQIASSIDAVVAAARARYEVGSGIQADVIRAQLSRSDIDHQLLTLRGRRDAAAVRLLALLGLPALTDVPRLHLAHELAQPEISAAPSVPQSHPALLALAAEVSALDERLRLTELLAKPDWNIEASYGLRTEMKDMFSVVARVELPVRRKTTIDPRVRAVRAEREAALSAVEAERRRLNEALGIAFQSHAEANRQLALHEEVLVPQSKMAFESTLAAYESGRAPFEAVLATETAYLALEIDYYDYLAQHIKAIADFEAVRRGARFGRTSMAPGGPDARMRGTERATPAPGGMR